MDFVTTITSLAFTSIAVERAVTVIKPLYLKIKNAFVKKQSEECTKTEKEILTILVGPAVCIVSGFGIDIPGVNESTLIQQAIAGLIASLGSNVLHALMSIILAIKDSAESIKKPE